jgi:2-aminoadipate transaminase
MKKATVFERTRISTEKIAVAKWACGIEWSAIQEMMWIGSRPGVLSLALGLPEIEFFPAKEYAKAVERVLENDPLAMQYGVPFEPLKSHVVTLMGQRGVECNERQIFLTTGAQQGMALLSHLLLDHGGAVICEETIYTGFQQAIQPFNPRILCVSTSLDDGMDSEAVESILASGARPAFIYVIPDGHNPMGVSLSGDKREQLVRVAQHYAIPLIEDDPYGFLNYEAEALRPLRSLDDEMVFYIGSFSKILAPGLRVGWIVAPEAMIPKIAIVKEAVDINTATFTQRTISAYLDTGHSFGHISFLREQYKLRRDAMINALQAHLADAARWRIPTSGFFVWVELLNRVNMRELLKSAVEIENVAFIPGQAFCVNGAADSKGIRLNFSYCSIDRIEEGIARLARVIKNGTHH